MKPIGIALLAAAFLALTATPGLAQYVVSAKAGTVNFTEGLVQLDGRTLESSLTHYPDIKEGSVLSTQEGRAEILLTPGVTLRLGDHASLKMITNRLIDTRLELLSGKAVVEADEIAKDTSVTIVVNNTAVLLPKAGVYRFDSAQAQVKVFKGEAAVQSDAETKLVGAGRAYTLGDADATVGKFNTDDTDALDIWSHRRGELMAMANVSGASLFNSGQRWYVPGGYMGLGMPFMSCSGMTYGFWGYNPWYDMYSYMPCGGMAYSPYGYGYAFVSPYSGAPLPKPGGVATAPTRGPKRGPIQGPTRGPVSIAAISSMRSAATFAAHPPMALAVNGSHTPGFRGGTGATTSFSSASAGHGGFAGYSGGGGYAGGGGYSGGGGSVSSSGGGYSGGGGASAGPAGGHGGFSGGGGASAGSSRGR